jgi:ribonuclease J
MDFLEEDGLYFVPLGGSEQFGVNLNVYAAQGRMIAIDCGIGFADERFPGIDILLPDPQMIEEFSAQLDGLIITHAHEDHIGAVAYLWPRLKCPIYALPFTLEVLKRKLEEQGVKNVPVHVVHAGESLSLGAMNLTFLPVAHSIPDAMAVLIEAEGVKALHSGDWNLDPAPVVGAKTEASVFQALGGVDVYIGDSTNAGVPGRAGSESEIGDGLYAEFAKADGRVFVTTFSSNIGRLMSVMSAARKADRQVAVIGRSMHRMIGAAIACGYLGDFPDLISEEDMGYVPDNKLVVMCTGSQGEGRAALSKIARGDHPVINTKRGDTVIFSARTIPGNDLAINVVKNNLVAGGVKVVTPSNTKNKIHVSGHPCQDEILDMWSWVKPRVVIPVHGERMQLQAQAALAQTAQVPEIIVPTNGSVIKLGPGEAQVIDHVETGLLAVDQKRVITAYHPSISTRRKLQYTGVAHVSVAIDDRGDVLGDVMLNTIGLIDEQDAADLQLEDKLYDLINDALDKMGARKRCNDEYVEDELRVTVRRYCRQILGFNPKTTVHVIKV